MAEIIIENIVQIVVTLLITLIGVLGTWLTAKLVKREELKNISAATNEVIQMAQTTVLELQQTIVDNMKAAHEDGKLTKDEITSLGLLLLEGTKEKMSATTASLLNAAGVDINAVIIGAGEALINRMKE